LRTRTRSGRGRASWQAPDDAGGGAEAARALLVFTVAQLSAMAALFARAFIRQSLFALESVEDDDTDEEGEDAQADGYGEPQSCHGSEYAEEHGAASGFEHEGETHPQHDEDSNGQRYGEQPSPDTEELPSPRGASPAPAAKDEGDGPACAGAACQRSREFRGHAAAARLGHASGGAVRCHGTLVTLPLGDQNGICQDRTGRCRTSAAIGRSEQTCRHERSCTACRCSSRRPALPWRDRALSASALWQPVSAAAHETGVYGSAMNRVRAVA
jgi:hypothetical protein